jgi:Pyruvate/2-oxoacid:ferredoxin oxidoreductase gamma subunit
MNIAAEIISEEFPEKIAKLNIPALQKGFEEIKKEI